MKLFLVILLSSYFAFAQSKPALIAKFSVYAQSKTESVEGDAEKDFRDLAQIKLTDTDLALVQNALLTLVKLDKEDPSRTSVQILAKSYSKNAKLFQKAFQIIRTSENKDTIQEIEEMMKSAGGGNG